MVTIVDANTGRDWTTCATGNFFVGALHRQYGLAYDAGGICQAMPLAMANTAQRFTFSVEAALQNVSPSYTPYPDTAVW